MTTTLYDKVTLLPMLSVVIAKTLLAAVTGTFARSKAANSYTEHVLQTTFRNLFAGLTTGQLQLICPPFQQVYEGWCKKEKITPDIVDIPNTNVKGFWIGSKDSAKYVMVYYHGGGFVLPGLASHIDMFTQFLKFTNGQMAIFCPCYTLAPEALYPLQLGQSVEALRYALSLRSPGSVLIGGDSAGGNLVLAVLSHVSDHPHPNSEVVKPLELSEPLKGALAIAPWVSSDDAKFPCMRELANVDVVGPICAKYWIDVYKGEGKNVKDDNYTVPELAEPGWWSAPKVSSVLATAGELEALIDAIKSWAGNFEQGGSGVLKLVVGKGEIHDAPVYPKPDSELDRLGEEGSQEGAIKAWFKRILDV